MFWICLTLLATMVASDQSRTGQIEDISEVSAEFTGTGNATEGDIYNHYIDYYSEDYYDEAEESLENEVDIRPPGENDYVNSSDVSYYDDYYNYDITNIGGTTELPDISDVSDSYQNPERSVNFLNFKTY